MFHVKHCTEGCSPARGPLLHRSTPHRILWDDVSRETLRRGLLSRTNEGHFSTDRPPSGNWGYVARETVAVSLVPGVTEGQCSLARAPSWLWSQPPSLGRTRPAASVAGERPCSAHRRPRTSPEAGRDWPNDGPLLQQPTFCRQLCNRPSGAGRGTLATTIAAIGRLVPRAMAVAQDSSGPSLATPPSNHFVDARGFVVPPQTSGA